MAHMNNFGSWAGSRIPALPRSSAERSVHGTCVPPFYERNVPAQDIGAALLDPDVHVRGGRRDAGAEDPAAEAALFAGFVNGGGHCL